MAMSGAPREGVGGVPEFPVVFGFTRDCERIGAGAFEFKGVVKPIPGVVGIYRTGDAWGSLLFLLRTLVSLAGRGRWGYPSTDDVTSRPTDVAPDTDGTPEHVIDAKRMTLLHDERRHFIIIQVPGTRHFVLKARRQGLTPASAVEDELVDALERCGHTRATAVECRLDFFASLPPIALVAVIVFALALFLAFIFRG